ncbi:MAG: hypothetical protein ABIX01_24005 [Chitinophagaceae bacterium]
MKKNILITGTALTVALVVFSNSVFSQPVKFESRYPQRHNQGSYPQQWQQPAAPFIIVDGEGRRNGYQGRNFDQCFEQRSLSRKQRRKLEKRYGFLPPLVMYVPDRYVTRTSRDEFYTYNNGVRYEKQRDGFFHLDDRYFGDNDNNWDDRNDRGNWNNNNDRDNNRNRF